MNIITNTFRTLCLTLVLCLGLNTAWAQTPPTPTYAGATPTPGKVYRIKARYDQPGGMETFRPIVREGDQAHLKNATDVVDPTDVDGFWIWTPVTGGGFNLVSGSGDGKAFKYVASQPGTLQREGATLFDQTQGGVRGTPNTTALHMKAENRWIVAHNTADQFGVFSNIVYNSAWSTDFLLEEVKDVERYDVKVFGAMANVSSSVRVKYTAGHSSQANDADGIPADGFFLFPTGTTPDASKFTAIAANDETPQVRLNVAEKRIEVYSREPYIQALNAFKTLNLAQLFPTAELDNLLNAVQAHNWGTTDQELAESKAFMESQIEALWGLADGRVMHLKNFGYGHYLSANDNQLVVNATATPTAQDVFYLHHVGGGVYNLMAYRADGRDRAIENTRTENATLQLQAADTDVANRGTYQLDFAKLATNPNTISFHCTAPLRADRAGIHEAIGNRILVWDYANLNSYWIIEPVNAQVFSQAALDALDALKPLPVLYADRDNTASYTALEAAKTAVNQIPNTVISTLAEARAAQTAPMTKVADFCQTQTRERFFFLNSASTSADWGKYYMYARTTGNTNLGAYKDDYRHKPDVFTFEFAGLDALQRPKYFVRNLSINAYITPTGNADWQDVELSSTNKGEYRLNQTGANNRVVLDCANGLNAGSHILHLENSYDISTWNNSSDGKSQWNIVPIERQLLDYYRNQMLGRKNAPLLFDATAVDTHITQLDPLTFATEAEINASVASADQKLVEVDQSADGRLFYLENKGRTGKFVSQNDARTAMRGTTDARNLKQIFSLKYIGNGRFRVLQFGEDSDKVLGNLPNNNQSVPLVDLADTNIGSYALDFSKSSVTDKNIVGFISDVSGNMAHRYLHMNNGDNLVPWDGIANASFWTLHPIEDHVKQPAIDRITPLSTAISLLYPTDKVEASKQAIQNLAFPTSTEALRQQIADAKAQVERIFNLADGQIVYFKHESGARYASAASTSTALTASTTTTPTKTEAFVLRHLGDGTYSLVHAMSGRTADRTPSQGNAIPLLAASTATAALYRFATGGQDNRVGIVSQNPVDGRKAWWHSPGNSLIPWETNSGNSHWDIELTPETVIDEIWNEKKSNFLPELGDKVGTYRDTQVPARTKETMEAEIEGKWTSAAATTLEAERRKEKGKVLGNLFFYAYDNLVLNLPTTGRFYRFIREEGGAKRMLTSPIRESGLFSMTESTVESEIDKIFYLTDDRSLLSPGYGRYAKSVALVDPAYSHDQFTFEAAPNLGRSLYYIQPQAGVYFSGSGENAATLLSSTSATVGWKIECVEKFPVTFRTIPDGQDILSDANLSVATLFCPQALQLVPGLKAYRGVLNAAKTELEMAEITGTIPANTPVVLVGQGGSSHLLPILYDDTTPTLTGNDLLGQQEALATPGAFTLQSPAATKHTGFYPFSGSILSGFRAYLPNTLVIGVAPTQGLTLRFPDLTAITLPVGINALPATPVYDLSGRRVEHPRLGGVYIVGGHKQLR